MLCKLPSWSSTVQPRSYAALMEVQGLLQDLMSSTKLSGRCSDRSEAYLWKQLQIGNATAEAALSHEARSMHSQQHLMPKLTGAHTGLCSMPLKRLCIVKLPKCVGPRTVGLPVGSARCRQGDFRARLVHQRGWSHQSSAKSFASRHQS